MTLDARAAAYGGTATASGFIAPPSARRPLSFDLRGSAENVNLKKLPASTQAPALETDLSVAQYHVTGAGRTIAATATLNTSVVEGATFSEGTVAEFNSTNGEISYAARGGVEGLDLQRIGGALKVAALARPEYQSQIAGSFDVRGSGTKLESMSLDATGTLTDASILDARLTNVAFESHLKDAALDTTVKGAFEGLNPARLANQERLDGSVTGTVDASFRIDDLTAPITPEAIAANGRLTLEGSRVGDLRIDAAGIEGKYADRVGDITQLTLSGPDLSVNASGRLALDEATDSNLKYLGRGDRSRAGWQARRTGRARRSGHGRGHPHRKRRPAENVGLAEWQQRHLPGEQRARFEQQVPTSPCRACGSATPRSRRRRPRTSSRREASN